MAECSTCLGFGHARPGDLFQSPFARPRHWDVKCEDCDGSGEVHLCSAGCGQKLTEEEAAIDNGRCWDCEPATTAQAEAVQTAVAS